MDTAESLKLTVKEIANTLGLIADGDVAHAEDGSLVQISELPDDEKEDVEQVSMYDYVEQEMLDCSYRVSARREYEGAEIYVTLGGPTIYIDTSSCTVKGSWGSDFSECGFTSEAQDQLDEVMRELYLCSE